MTQRFGSPDDPFPRPAEDSRATRRWRRTALHGLCVRRCRRQYVGLMPKSYLCYRPIGERHLQFKHRQEEIEWGTKVDDASYELAHQVETV
jgi:hypothetical protein